jgi:endonuclease/exonuclease/phosphatase family metal-dependent hydrolase
VVALVAALLPLQGGQVPVVSQTNLTFTVMAANLTGNSQYYSNSAFRIFQALKPDIVAIQEFRYSNCTPSAIRAMVDCAFGTNYSYYRDGYTNNGDIPNGIITRFPIRNAGYWVDAAFTYPNRGFAWADLELPDGHHLYVVSVHLLSSAGATVRATEAANLKALIQSNFASNAWVIVAGDLNTGTRGEGAVTTLKTFLSDDPVPTDATVGGEDNTNEPRSKPYDYVLPSFSFTNNLAPVVVGGQSFSNGLVFDSRVFTPLSAVPPVLYDDSTEAQHMPVMKAFRITCTVTNWVTVPAPRLTISPSKQIRWSALSNLTFCVQANSNLSNRNGWLTLGTVCSATTNFSLTITNSGPGQRFYRVTCP